MAEFELKGVKYDIPDLVLEHIKIQDRQLADLLYEKKVNPPKSKLKLPDDALSTVKTVKKSTRRQKFKK